MVSPRLLSLACLVLFCCSASAQQQIGKYSSLSNTRSIPAENVVHFFAANPSIAIELVGEDHLSKASLSGAHVVLVDAEGKSREFKADENGKVVVDNVQEGVFALLASTNRTHSASLLVMKSNEAEAEVEVETNVEDLFEIDFLPEPQSNSEPKIETVKVTMMTVLAAQIRPIIDNNLPESLKASVKSIDQAYVMQAEEVASTGIDVQLGRGGTLRGTLQSVIRPSSIFSAVSGTNVVVFKNGKPVGLTKANALGQFQLNGLSPGVHGLVVAGRGGYAALSINVLASENSETAGDDDKYTYTALQFEGDIFRVTLIPPPMLPSISKEILAFYPKPSPILEKEEESGRIEIVAKPKKQPAAKRKPLVSTTNVPSSTFVLDQSLVTNQLRKSASNSASQSNVRAKRNIPANPLRQTRPNRRGPFNPLRP